MAITITGTPAGNSCWSRNPIRFKVNTDRYIINAGQAYIVDCMFDINPSPGDFIEFLFPERTVMLFCAATPNDTGYQFPTRGAMSLGNYTLALRGVFRNNYELNSRFLIDFGNTNQELRFEAREVGLGYEFPPLTGQLPGLTSHVVVPAMDRNYVPDFAVACNLYVESSFQVADYEKIATLWGFPNEQGDCEFFIEEDLNARMENQYPVSPSVITGGINKRWYVEFSEYYADDWETDPIPYHHRLTRSLTYIVVKGGVKKEDFEYYPALTGGVLQAGKRWLTWYNDLPVTQAQPVFISFHFFTAAVAPFFRFVVYYSDGTSSTISSLPMAGRLQYATVTFDVGFTSRNLHNVQPSKTPIRYTVQLIDNVSTELSEAKSFKLSEPHRRDRYILYENSFGVFELMRCTGILTGISENEKITAITAENTLSSGIQDERIIDAQYQETYQISTGGISDRRNSKLLAEFFSSTQYFLIEFGQRIPIVIEQDSVPTDADDTNLYGASFRFRKAFLNKNYSIR